MSEQEQNLEPESPEQSSESESGSANPEGGTPQGAPDAAVQAPDGPHGSPQPK